MDERVVVDGLKRYYEIPENATPVSKSEISQIEYQPNFILIQNPVEMENFPV